MKKLKKVEKKSWKQVEKKLKNESSRIWCPKIMTWKKLKSDQEEEEEQTYVKDTEQECPRSKKDWKGFHSHRMRNEWQILQILERWLNLRESFTLNPTSKKVANHTSDNFPFGAQWYDLAHFFEHWSQSENLSEI